MNGDEVEEVIKFKTVWWKALRQIQKDAKQSPKQDTQHAPGADILVGYALDKQLSDLSISDPARALSALTFTEKDKRAMQNLPRKECRSFACLGPCNIALISF